MLITTAYYNVILTEYIESAQCHFGVNFVIIINLNTITRRKKQQQAEQFKTIPLKAEI